jgi:uncharacterized membrane protein YcaP (DUF421 family)
MMFHEIWSNMFSVPVPLLEKMIRPIIVYLFLILMFRVFGRRELAQINPLDLTVLLLLSNTVQNAIIGQDDSLLGGLIGAVALLSANKALNYFAYRQEHVASILEGIPRVLIEHGQVNQAAVKAEEISPQDLDEAIHRTGVEHVNRVKWAHLEPSGTITVIPMDDARIELVLERLARLETMLLERRPEGGATRDQPAIEPGG